MTKIVKGRVDYKSHFVSWHHLLKGRTAVAELQIIVS